jgi:putative Mg2+ transporter-C (MgtC) family protein
MALLESICRLGLALLLGSTIGVERQWHQKMAGLRTNALVALGSCGFVVFSSMVGEGDPTRIAAQVVTGIGFLGAGVILREGVNVHGLNTSATLWCSAMVGTFAGAGYWAPSVVAAAFVVGTNICLRPLIRRVNSRIGILVDAETYYTVTLTCKNTKEAHLRSVLLHALSQAGLGLRRMDSADIPDTLKVRVTAQAVAPKRVDAALEQIVGRLSLEPHISAATWQVDRTMSEAELPLAATQWPPNGSTPSPSNESYLQVVPRSEPGQWESP